MAEKQSRKEWIKVLDGLSEWTDYEVCHREADDLLCTILEHLGYADVVKAYNKVGKWYA